MSQIFDALQRSEAERSGIDLSALSEATELLRRAERQEASKWEAAVLSEQPNATERLKHDTSFGRQGEAPVTRTLEASEGTELSATDERLDMFGLFQSLTV